MRIAQETPLHDIPRDAWNALAIGDDPFLTYDYFAALETNGCTGSGRHFDSRHLTIWADDGALLGVAPLFLKSDSWGEFVFDFAWADAYRMAGGAYYPKLVSALPYTPVTGRRLLTRAGEDAATIRRALIDAVLDYARTLGVSSWHVLFCAPEELADFEAAGLLLREACQFQWHNAGYRDFDDYLASFRSARRKKTRRERSRIRDAGIHFKTLRGDQMSAEQWRTFFGFYASSFVLRGNEPYFPERLFPDLAATLGERMLVKFACIDDRDIAAALFFSSPTCLYGRYWGCSEQHDSLHFETCYYQGIEHCIEHGIDRFDPGTQGEHKIARGFAAQSSWSCHWLAEPQFRDAIADYLGRERSAVEEYKLSVDQHLPFRRSE